MKFLIIEQDLRISGTSQGVISRSFLAKLRTSYPDSIIDVVYIKTYEREDRLDLLPVNSIESHLIHTKIPFFVKFLNRFYWRLFHQSLNENYIHQQYAKVIAKINYQQYDHIFVRSAGLNCETIIATFKLPILEKAIITFNEPYPNFWCAGSKDKLSNLELFRLKKMQEITAKAKGVLATELLAKDMQYLYGSTKRFYFLPHHFTDSVFDFTDTKNVVKKTKKVTISYHGAVQFGRNITLLLKAYHELTIEHIIYKTDTEFIIRAKGNGVDLLKNQYINSDNIQILDTLNFSNSSYEQIYETDIPIILENGPLYCNILVGKAPFLAFYNKPILCLSPPVSEMRNIIVDEKYIADMNDVNDIKVKLKFLIDDRLNSNELHNPFGDYFSDENFKIMLDKVLNYKS